jgi:sec-independent protein translocase protein TatC
MAKRYTEEDYFAHTTMTFGEHLEELRRSLLKAVLGIGVGFLIGMLLSSTIVRYVQQPLERAMERYYINLAVEKDPALKNYPPGDREKVALNMIRRKLTYSYYYIEPTEVERLYQRIFKQQVGHGNASPTANPPTGNTQQPSEPSLEPGLPDPNAHMEAVRVWTPVKAQVTALGAEEPFMIWLKAALVAGLVVSAPWAFYHIWTFVAAGLYPHEQRYVYVFLPFSLGLFLLGVCTAFFIVFDPVLDFLLQFNRSMNIDPDPRISNWMTFVLFLPLGFGIAFQLPLVMLFLSRIGIVPAKVMAEKWRIAILVITVLSAVLTPADPISMIAMALPLTVLYFLGIALCYWMPSIRRPDEVYE